MVEMGLLTGIGEECNAGEPYGREEKLDEGKRFLASRACADAIKRERKRERELKWITGGVVVAVVKCVVLANEHN